MVGEQDQRLPQSFRLGRPAPRGYIPAMRVTVLGAGFGGLELTSRLSAEFGHDADVVLIDQSDVFIFGFSKLDVMFGHAQPSAVRHHYSDIVKPGVRFVRTTVRSIDPFTKRVETDAGPFDADVLVVALGADLHPDATPGLVEGGHEFYTVAGAFALHDVLSRFEGGRVIVGVTSTPFKCPPAPSETALLTHDFLTGRGLRDASQISVVMPMGVPIPPSPAASQAVLGAFAERGIEWHPDRLVRALDPDRNVALLSDGSEMPYDLFLGIPVHRAPVVVQESGLAVDGWIPVDPLTLETDVPRRLRRGRRDERRNAEGGRVRRGAGRSRRRRHQRAHSPQRGIGPVRRPRHVLHGVRPQPGRPRRCHVRRRPETHRRL